MIELGTFNINSKYMLGYDEPTTILYRAVQWNGRPRMKCIKMLLKEMGANPNIGYLHGWDSLVLASEKENIKLMKLLIKFGAKVNRPELNFNALCGAVRLNKPESVRFLLENGADINLKEALSQKSALELANEQERETAASKLIKEFAQMIEESQNN